MKKFYFSILITLLALFSACSGGGNDNYDTLIASKWQLQSIVSDQGGDSIVPIDPVTIIFTDSSTVSGNGGCNVFFGVYSTIGDDEIDIEIKGRSMAMCPSLDVEDKVISTLDLASSYSACNGELQINNLEDGVTLIFKQTK